MGENIVRKLRETAMAVEDVSSAEIAELLRDAAEHIDALQRQQQDGETFLNFSSRSPQQENGRECD